MNDAVILHFPSLLALLFFVVHSQVCEVIVFGYGIDGADFYPEVCSELLMQSAILDVEP